MTSHTRRHTLYIYAHAARLICSLALALAPCLAAQAQWLEKPARFVPGDSVRVWGYYGDDLVSLGRRTGAQAEPLPLALTKKTARPQRKLLREWGKELAAVLVTGSTDAPYAKTQAQAATPLYTHAARLLQLTGNAAYADYMERVLHNAAAQSAAVSAAPDNKETQAAAALLASMPEAVYMQNGEDLYVNLYTNSTARLSSGGKSFTLDQITNMPDEGAVRLRLTRFPGTLRLRLHLRMPDWATGETAKSTPFRYATKPEERVRVFLCGHEIDVKDLRGGYLTVENEWEEMNEVYISFPFSALLLRPAEAGDNPLKSPAAIQRGPQVYAVQTDGLAGCYLPSSSLPELDTDDGTALRGKAYRKDAAPQDAAAPEVPYTAQPYSRTSGGTLWVE